jgi:CheY-specific phosphatase CheX
MSEEATGGLPETEPAAKGLDAILSSAIEAAEAPAEAVETKSTTESRTRDESGRFVAKEPAAAEAPVKGPAEAAAKPADQATVEPAQQPLEPPARWSEAEKAKFATWGRDVQEAVLERHKGMEADYTRKTQELSSFRSQAEPLLKAVEPHQAYLAQLASQAGTTPASLVHDVLTAERTLRSGTPEQKVTALLQIAADYGIDLRGVAGGGQAQALDPLTQDMRQTVSQLANRVAEQEQRHLVAESERITADIASFASAKDASGNLLRPYFEQVRPIMGQMMQNGQAATLDEAYSKAIQPFQAMITAEVKAKDAAAEKARLEAVEKAKRAAPVRSTGSQPGGSVQGKGLDAHLNAAFAKAGVA